MLTFDCASLVLKARISRAGGAITHMAFSPTGQLLWAVTAQRQLLCLDAATGKPLCLSRTGGEVQCTCKRSVGFTG